VSAPESREGRLVLPATGGPISDPQRPRSGVSGAAPSRLVRCQYRQDPHPLDDECVNVTDVWTDERLEAGLRRVFAAVDGPPPQVHVRPDPGLHAHDIADAVAGCAECAAKEAAEVRRDFEQLGCAQLPEGDGRHDYRVTSSSYYGTGRDHPDRRDGQTTYRCRRCGDVFVALDSEMRRNLEEEQWRE
jgi:hypothetical protein